MAATFDPSRLMARAGRGAPGEIEGFVFDPHEPWRRFVVELRFDGLRVAIATAERYTHELADTEGDGGHGFVFAEPADAVDVGVVEVFLANSEVRIGEPIAWPAVPDASEAPAQAEVSWRGGLRLSGIVERRGSEDGGRVLAFVDGECVAQARLERWAARMASAVASIACPFDIWLPETFADGVLRRVHVRDDLGREMRGSPCAVIAFADGIANFLASRAPMESADPRVPWLERVCPQSLAFPAFSAHRGFYVARGAARSPTPRVAVALVGEVELDASLGSLESQRHCVWTAGVFADGGIPLAFSPEDLAAFLQDEAADAEVVAFAPGGAIFEPEALSAFAGALRDAPSADVVYADFSVRGSDGGEWPLAQGAFDYERTMEQGAGAFLFAMRASVARAALEAGAADLFRLFNFPLDRSRGPLASIAPALASPIHAPGIAASLRLPDPRAASRRLAASTAAHLAARGIADCDAAPEFGGAFPTARLRRANPGLSVTCVLWGRGGVERAVAELRAAFAGLGTIPGEALVVAPSGSPEYGELAKDRVRLVQVAGSLSALRAANLAATAGSADLLWLWDPGLETDGPGALEEMIGRLAEPEVGAVGPMLIGPEGRVAALGYALGMDFSVAPRFAGEMPEADVYGDALRVAHACSAMPAAGMLVRRDLFRQLGGFDLRRFPQRYADVDFGLRLRASGFRNLVAPRARLHATLSQPPVPLPPPGNSATGRREPDWDLARLRAKWGEALVADPAYSPLLTLSGDAYSGLAWPPRPLAPRSAEIPGPADLPPSV